MPCLRWVDIAASLAPPVLPPGQELRIHRWEHPQKVPNVEGQLSHKFVPKSSIGKVGMVKENPVIHVFYCSNSMSDSEVETLQSRFGNGGLRMLSLPCSGKTTIPYLLKAFEAGADGVAICTCKPSECKNLEGNLRAAKRADAVDGLVAEAGLGKDRVLMITKEQGQIEKVIDGLGQFRKRLEQKCEV
jgi:coenzyme F420-reducing hydrogenase delta subunit